MKTELNTMIEGTEDQLKVSFPASPTFTRVGRVAVAGLALRLGVDIATVEKLRAAVDTAVGALLGAGRIDMLAAWQPAGLKVSLSNPEASVNGHGDLADELAGLVGKATVDDTTITLELRT